MPKREKKQIIQKNIVSYAKDYRSFSFYKKGLTEVDSLILSQIVYFNFAGTAFEEEEFSYTLYDLIYERRSDLRDWAAPLNEDEALLKLLKQGGRHGGIRGCDFVAITDAEAEKQFAAVTFELRPGLYYLAFRGTDNSLTGWKEDLNLSHQDVIPAQEEALKYALRVMAKLDGDVYLGGHSKGGNLAVYVAMNLPVLYQARILGIYDHDGPGFEKSVYATDKYKQIRPLIHKTIPQASVVGMLWEEDDNYKVIHSKALGLLQHQPYSWVVQGDQFKEDQLEQSALSTKHILESWVDELEKEERKLFIDTVFDTIEKTEVERFYDFSEESLKKMKLLSESISEVEEEDKERVKKTMKRLWEISKEEFLNFREMKEK